MGDMDPIPLRPRSSSLGGGQSAGAEASSTFGAQTIFNRREFDAILSLYGRKVAEGQWRDYAIDFDRDKAVFSVFRRASEVPLYRIEKTPKLAARQGAYSVVAASGLILKRGHDLRTVLAVLERKPGLVK